MYEVWNVMNGVGRLILNVGEERERDYIYTDGLWMKDWCVNRCSGVIDDDDDDDDDDDVDVYFLLQSCLFFFNEVLLVFSQTILVLRIIILFLFLFLNYTIQENNVGMRKLVCLSFILFYFFIFSYYTYWLENKTSQFNGLSVGHKVNRQWAAQSL